MGLLKRVGDISATNTGKVFRGKPLGSFRPQPWPKNMPPGQRSGRGTFSGPLWATFSPSPQADPYLSKAEERSLETTGQPEGPIAKGRLGWSPEAGSDSPGHIVTWRNSACITMPWWATRGQACSFPCLQPGGNLHRDPTPRSLVS